jgi:L-2-hydroxyglutarate oxidase LhgO
MDEVKVTIIGAGVVGLAIAAELSGEINDVVVLERNGAFGQETSSRNSEVIHSGIYYPAGSLKTRLCVEGSRLLYRLCERYSVPYKRLGKLIVAKDLPEVKSLESLYNNGLKNALSNIAIIDKKKVSAFGANVKAEAAIYLPDTGIIDSHSLMKHYARFSEENGATIAYNSNVIRIEPAAHGYELTVEQDSYTFSSRIVINSAGLSSDRVAGLAGIDINTCAYKIHFCKGSYFHYAKHYPMPLLIYPVPQQELTGLGVHATLDLGGRLRFGPDTEYVDEINYTVDASRRDSFYASASETFPDLDKDAFIPDMAGVRPKLSGPGDKVRDFVVADETEKGLPGFINLIGIESPGLTSSPAIARMVANMVKERLA